MDVLELSLELFYNGAQWGKFYRGRIPKIQNHRILRTESIMSHIVAPPCIKLHVDISPAVFRKNQRIREIFLSRTCSALQIRKIFLSRNCLTSKIVKLICREIFLFYSSCFLCIFEATILPVELI